ncbi:YkvA family protein [Sporofaciens sp. SGI.106]|uniref:YkvA family protein n=1 Tax=Sporofaciens sp. SGI.106 TaxID=3420568 RepID=UPI003D05A7C8
MNREDYNLIKIKIPAIFLSLKDPETPLLAKILAAVTVGYALSPIDLIPDFIPVLGYFDDVILLPALIALTIRFIPKDVWMKHQEQAKNMWSEGRPKKWYYGIPVVIIWILIFYLIVTRIIFH